MTTLAYIEPNATDAGTTLMTVGLVIASIFILCIALDILHQLFFKK